MSDYIQSFGWMGGALEGLEGELLTHVQTQKSQYIQRKIVYVITWTCSIANAVLTNLC